MAINPKGSVSTQPVQTPPVQQPSVSAPSIGLRFSGQDQPLASDWVKLGNGKYYPAPMVSGRWDLRGSDAYLVPDENFSRDEWLKNNPYTPTANPQQSANTQTGPVGANGTPLITGVRGEQVGASDGGNILDDIGGLLENLFQGAFGGQQAAPPGQTWDALQGWVPSGNGSPVAKTPQVTKPVQATAKSAPLPPKRPNDLASSQPSFPSLAGDVFGGGRALGNSASYEMPSTMQGGFSPSGAELPSQRFPYVPPRKG
jgi:hypothetical protein